MIKLAIAVGFLAVFGFVAVVITYILNLNNKNKNETK